MRIKTEREEKKPLSARETKEKREVRSRVVQVQERQRVKPPPSSEDRSRGICRMHDIC